MPGLADVFYTYDNRGRLTQVIEGEDDQARTATISYDPDSGYVAQLTDALQRTEEFTRDKVGRVLKQKLPDSRQIEYEYDQNGNLTALKPVVQSISMLIMRLICKPSIKRLMWVWKAMKPYPVTIWMNR